MPVNIYSTEKRAFIIVPRKFKYIIAEILVKKNVGFENPAFWVEKFSVDGKERRV